MELKLNLYNDDFCSNSDEILAMFGEYGEILDVLSKFNTDKDSNLTTRLIKKSYLGKELNSEEKSLVSKFFDELEIKIKVGEKIDLVKNKSQDKIFYVMNDFFDISYEDKQKIGNLKKAIDDFISQVNFNVTNLVEKKESGLVEAIDKEVVNSEIESGFVIIDKDTQEIVDFLNDNHESQRDFFYLVYEEIKNIGVEGYSGYGKRLFLNQFFGRNLSSMGHKNRMCRIVLGHANCKKDDPIISRLMAKDIDYKLIIKKITGEYK